MTITALTPSMSSIVAVACRPVGNEERLRRDDPLAALHPGLQDLVGGQLVQVGEAQRARFALATISAVTPGVAGGHGGLLPLPEPPSLIA